MSNLINFQFQSATNIRTLLINDEIWFVASDIATALDYRMASDMTRFLDDDEKATHNLRTPYGEQKFTIINESGLYSAILKSRKPEAKVFKKWVTSEVLPQIRKTGSYHTARPSNELTPKQHDALHRLVALCKMNFFRQDSASHAIWSRLRRVTGVKYPQKFTTEHLPILSRELQEIFLATEQYANAVRLAEQTFIRQVLKCNDKDIMAKLLSDISDAADTHHQQKQQLIPALFGKPLAELNS